MVKCVACGTGVPAGCGRRAAGRPLCDRCAAEAEATGAETEAGAETPPRRFILNVWEELMREDVFAAICVIVIAIGIGCAVAGIDAVVSVLLAFVAGFALVVVRLLRQILAELRRRSP